MKHRRILSILLAAATAVSVAGCSKNETSGSESSAPDDSSSPAGVQTASNVSANGWEFNQVAMGGGGFVSGVFATSQEGLYYARTDVGGAYRYNKDTQLWESMSYGISEDDQGFLGIAGLAYGDKDPNRVYLLAGTSYLSGGRTALFISNDYGSTFTRTELTDYIKVDGNGMGRGNGERLAVDPKNSDIVYAAGMSSGGLIKSTDGGQTFTYLDLGVDTSTNNNNGICSILIDPQSGDDSSCSTIYAALSSKGDYNLFKSTDAGATWAPVEDAPKGLMVQRMKYNGDGKIVLTYASTEGPWNNPRGNGGIRLLNIADDSITDITPEKNGYGDVVIDPANPDRMVAVTENVYDQQANGTFGDDFYVTTDGGKTWKNINLDMTMSGGDVSWHNESSMHWCSSLAIDPHNTGKIMVVSGNGIFSCDNIWDEHPAFYFFAEGIEETVPYELVSIPGGELVTVVGDYDGFTQDDAHIFCAPEQIKDEFLKVMDIILYIFKALDFQNFEAQISLRDPKNKTKYIGSDENWHLAESAIIEACAEKGLNAKQVEGEAAFYGPKLDFMVKDAIGRRWQLGTIQVDYNLPERFQLEYTGADNQKHRPVMIHRAPFGSMERFVAVLLEHTAGKLPLWLIPEQCAILPISEKFNEYAWKVASELDEMGVRATVDDRNEKIGRKIRDNELRKTPYLLIVGEKEMADGTVSVRRQGEGDKGTMTVDAFAKMINEAVDALTKQKVKQ